MQLPVISWKEEGAHMHPTFRQLKCIQTATKYTKFDTSKGTRWNFIINFYCTNLFDRTLGLVMQILNILNNRQMYLDNFLLRA